MWEAENAKSLYYAVAYLDNEVPDITMITASVDSPDRLSGKCYGTFYEMKDKPWMTEEMKELASLRV